MSLFEKVLTALSPEQEHAASNGAVNRPRRNLMLGAGAVAIGLANARAADAAGNEAGHAGIDRSCRVSAARLDKLVADAYPLFNKPAILPAFDPKTHGARFDVDLHRLVTYTVNPQSGEKIKVSGLLALPVGASGKLPLVSWQHGTILSFDQVPSNLVLLADPDRQLTDAADSLETLFNVHRFAAQGYAVIAADYVGKGPFRDGRGEAYAVKDVTVRTCVDVLRRCARWASRRRNCSCTAGRKARSTRNGCIRRCASSRGRSPQRPSPARSTTSARHGGSGPARRRLRFRAAYRPIRRFRTGSRSA
ncbi:hypothetical protein LGM32_14585 [Burkholderia vietnamiensis]|nr:hypothetical protein [Burkholderia vietnamiensis]